MRDEVNGVVGDKERNSSPFFVFEILFFFFNSSLSNSKSMSTFLRTWLCKLLSLLCFFLVTNV